MKKRLFGFLLTIIMALSAMPINVKAAAYYTVEFTYGELQYVLPGDSRVELTTALDTDNLCRDTGNDLSTFFLDNVHIHGKRYLERPRWMTYQTLYSRLV